MDDDFASVCYYGPPGSGKTTHMAHLADLGGLTAFFKAESGLKKIALKKRGINTDMIKDIGQVTAELMMDSFWKLKAKLEAEPGSYNGAALDTLNVLVNREVSAIRKREYEAGVAKAEAAGEEYEGPKKTWTSRDYFGEMTVDMRELIEHYIDLPMHLAFAAHVRRDDDEDGEIHYGPAATPAVQSEVVAWFDFIIRTQRVGPFFIGHTVASGEGGKYEGKDRYDVLPQPIMNLPTMPRIVAYLRGELTEDNDPIQQEWVKAAKGHAIIKKKEK